MHQWPLSCLNRVLDQASGQNQLSQSGCLNSKVFNKVLVCLVSHKCSSIQFGLSPMWSQSSGLNSVWSQSSSLNPVWSQSSVVSVQCGLNPVVSVQVGLNPVWSQSCVVSIQCGLNPLRLQSSGLSPVVSMPYGLNSAGTLVKT